MDEIMYKRNMEKQETDRKQNNMENIRYGNTCAYNQLGNIDFDLNFCV